MAGRSRPAPPRRLPTRSCVACRTARPKAELVRVVRMPDGTISLDATGRLPGRGAYLCRDAACFDLAARRRALAHALGTQIPPDVETLIAAGPDSLPLPTTRSRRTADPRLATPTSTIPEGDAHGQE